MDEPVIRHPGDGELVREDETGSSRIKIARDEILLSETTLRLGARGARPHIHREHADAFYVLEGSLDFHLAGEQRTIEAGGLVLAPPGVVHGFGVGPNGDRHLNIHTPGAAFARLTRARRDGVSVDAGRDGDTFSPPSDGGRPGSDAVVSQGGEGELHVGDEVAHGTPGTYVLAPPHVVHWFRNVSGEPARMLNLHTPGGFAEYRRELEALRTQGMEPDREFFERHDIFDV